MTTTTAVSEAIATVICVLEIDGDKQHDDRPPFATWAVMTVAAVAGLVAGLSATRYGYYYDELYFVAAGKRIAFSFADQGPLVPLIARSMDWSFPASFAALRIPAIAAALVVVVLGAVIAREFGGDRFAQVVAAAGVATSFCVLGGASTLSTNVIDTGLWAILSWLMVRWVRTRRDGPMVAAALVTVVALQVKWLVPVFWIAVLVAVCWVGPRDLLRRPALWGSAVVVALSAVPALFWQARHGWPQVGMGAIVRGQTSGWSGTLTFIPRAVEMCGVAGGALLVFGLWQLWRSPRLREYRSLGVALVLVIAVFAITGGRVEYGAGMYAAVIAAGAVEVSRMRTRWITISVVPLIAASAVAFVVWATPWRPASQLVPAADFAAGVAGQAYGEFGWSELTSAVTGVYRGLPTEQRRSAVIVTERYIQSSALDYNRSSAGLPAVFSPKRGFGYFGAPPDSATTVVWVGSNEPYLRRWFGSVVPVREFGVRLGMPQVTRDITIWECSDPKQPWSSMWPRMLNR
jgi:MFS family permease